MASEASHAAQESTARPDNGVPKREVPQSDVPMPQTHASTEQAHVGHSCRQGSRSSDSATVSMKTVLRIVLGITTTNSEPVCVQLLFGPAHHVSADAGQNAKYHYIPAPNKQLKTYAFPEVHSHSQRVLRVCPKHWLNSTDAAPEQWRSPPTCTCHTRNKAGTAETKQRMRSIFSRRTPCHTHTHTRNDTYSAIAGALDARTCRHTAPQQRRLAYASTLVSMARPQP